MEGRKSVSELPIDGRGNEEMIRTIIEQIVDTTEAKHKREAARAHHTFLGGHAPAWIAAVLAVMAMIFSAGVLRSEVAEAQTLARTNRTTIEALQIQNGEGKATIARIEAKIDILMAERKQ